VTRSAATGRREFLRTSLLGGLAAATMGRFPRLVGAAQATGAETASSGPSSRVALTAGEDRADNVFRGLRTFSDRIARAIGNRRVVIKPNNVSVDVQLAATHADCLEGILEFLKSIGKAEGAVIAESSGTGPTMEGFSNFGYPRVAEKYGVKLVDLDGEPTEVVHVFDQGDFRPHPVRMARLLLDRQSFIISAAKMKTHDLVVATLSLKNIVFGAPIKDPGFRRRGWGEPGPRTDKPLAHGSGIYGINYNLFALSQRLRPDLAVIDGYDGMQGNGPTRGTAVDHRICVASPDWLAADRVAVELMGIDFAKIGYLNYCAQANPDQADLKRIEIVGQPLASHVRSYRLHDTIEKQLTWMTPPEAS
jgi:uncharacterized protein (DUF362 family)